MTTWARNLLATIAALMLAMGLATQFVAAAFDYDPAFGAGVASVGGVRLYAPWEMLVWTWRWLISDPWFAALHIVLIGVCMLGAFAVVALAASVEPSSFVLRLSRLGFERWAILRQRGLLRAEGLALGAVRRHGLASHDLVRAPRGHTLLLGATEHTDDALEAALSSWRGALVIIAARDVVGALTRSEVLRFSPGRVDSIALNPLLNVRGGAHAWSDALTLARAYLREPNAVLTASLAALILDTLAHKAPAARSFGAMRQALADPGRRLAELSARWADGASDLGPATGELARVVRVLHRDGETALRALHDIDMALKLFADGDHALATEIHQLRFADLVTGDGPTTLVVEMAPGKEIAAAPLVSALLAQLVAACAPSADLDQLGRSKQRELLVVIEAHAVAALVADMGSSAPAHTAGWKGKLPVIDPVMRTAPARGCSFLVQAHCANDAGQLIGADDDHLADLGGAFAAINVIGPQSEPSAAMASALAGRIEIWRRWRRQPGAVRRWLFPLWERAVAPIVSAEELQTASGSEALLLMSGLKPIRCVPLSAAGAKPTYVAPSVMPLAPHDWNAPVLAPVARSGSAALTAPEQPSEPTPLAAVGSKLRRALTRRAVPVVPNKGERLI